MGPNVNQAIKLSKRLISLHTLTCSIQFSDKITTADYYVSLGLCIYIGLCASIRLCSVIPVNENENEIYEKRSQNEFVSEN